jgi:hypothetical protein
MNAAAMWETIRQFAARSPELVSVVSLGVGFASISTSTAKDVRR